MAILDKDPIGTVLDPIIGSFQTREDCTVALIEIRSQIAKLERDLGRAKLIRDELGERFSSLPKPADETPGPARPVIG